MTLDELAELLRWYQYPYGNEGLLQAAVEQVLKESGLDYRREVRLTEADRIDFMVGTLGIECKVDGASGSVLSQCLRYAESPDLSGLILLSSRHTHRFGTKELLGKPFRCVWVGGF